MIRLLLLLVFLSGLISAKGQSVSPQMYVAASGTNTFNESSTNGSITWHIGCLLPGNQLIATNDGIQVKALSTHVLDIYPNPFNDQLYILAAPNTAISQVRIYNVAGQLVFSMAMYNDNTVHELNLAGLRQGVYLLQLYNNNEAFGQSVIVKK